MNKTVGFDGKQIHVLFIKNHYIHLNWQFGMFVGLIESLASISFDMYLVPPLLNCE